MIKNQLLTKRLGGMLNAAILSTLFCVNLGVMKLNSIVEASKTETTNVLMRDVQAYNQMAIICGVNSASTDADNATIKLINDKIADAGITLDQFYIICCNVLLQSQGQMTQEDFNDFLQKQASELVLAGPNLEKSKLIAQN